MRHGNKKVFLIAVVVLAFLIMIPQAALSLPSGASSLQDSQTPSCGERFGVSSPHLKMWDEGTVEAELQAMNEARIGWVRCNFAWQDLEFIQGDWNLAGSDRLVNLAGEHGVEILGLLGGSPPWANGWNLPNYPPTDMAAWRNYIHTVCSRFKDSVKVWEIWNEEDIDAYWAPSPDPAAYMVLLQAAWEEIKAVDPEAVVMMGGLAGLGVGYLIDCLDLGLADYVDAIAYHPYPETLGYGLYTPQEEWSRQIAQFMRQLISSYTEKDIQLWITEIGWTTCSESPPGVDLDTQACYMLRTLISYASTDVDRILWYSMRDNPDGVIDLYGLIRGDFTPKPSYHYYATFQSVFGPTIASAPDAVSLYCSQPGTLEEHCFRTAGGNLAMAAWKSDDQADTLSLIVADPAYNRLLKVDPLTGERESIAGVCRDAFGRLTVSGLTVGKTPLILEASIVPTHGVTASVCGGHGEVSPAFQEVLEGDTAAVDIMPDPGYRIVSISDNGVEMTVRAPYLIQEVSEDHEVEITFDVIPSTSFLFAEGYTGSGFEEWLCLANPGTSPTTAHVTYMFEDGSTQTQDVPLGATTRETVFVNGAVGPGRDVSIKVTSDTPIVAERPMYFAYKGAWTGGHDVLGATPQ
jgi:hypothetical protein